jgi:hypothetical protein
MVGFSTRLESPNIQNQKRRIKMKATMNTNAILQDARNKSELHLSDETFDLTLSTAWKRVNAGTDGKDTWGPHWKIVSIPAGYSILCRKALNTSLPVFEGDYVVI